MMNLSWRIKTKQTLLWQKLFFFPTKIPLAETISETVQYLHLSFFCSNQTDEGFVSVQSPPALGHNLLLPGHFWRPGHGVCTVKNLNEHTLTTGYVISYT